MQQSYRRSLLVAGRFVLLFMCIVVASVVIIGQTEGRITGIVTDQNGAAVAGATVTVTSIERNQEVAKIETTGDGTYNVASLIPGTYSISVEKSGFAKTIVTSVKVDVAQTARLDVSLKVTSVSEVVTVTSTPATAELERETSGISQVITSNEIQQLPLFARNPINLIALAGGVSAGFTTEGSISSSQLSVNGSRTLNSEVTIDGVSAVVGSTGDLTFIPSVESLKEFRVQTSSYSAEYGRTSGATVTAVIQSGGSSYHGDVYEYFRNEALNANNFFNNSRGVAKPADRYNQFGVTFGGPLPFVGKNTFFFFNYEGLRRTVPRQFTSTVPIDAFRAGDFSGVSTIIKDPLTGQQVKDPTRGTASNPQGLNIIPIARFDPVAAALIKILPEPNLSGTLNNYFTNSKDNVDLNQLSTRIDQNIGSRIRLYCRYSQQTGTDATFTPDASIILPDPINPGTTPNKPIDRQLALGYIHTISQTVINEVIFGLNRNVQSVDPPTEINSPKDLGFQQLPQLSIDGNSGFYMPAITFTGGNYGFGAGNAARFGMNTNTLRRQITNTYSASDALTIAHGNHTFKTGLQIRYNQLNIFNGGGSFAGTFNISGDNLPGAPANNSATQFAAFLFGLVDSASYQIPQPETGRRNHNFAVFGQDDWKISPRFTVNLGLRWEYESPLTVNNGFYSRVDPLTGKLLVAGVNATDTLNLSADKKDFGPRVGFAYSLNDKTVVRAGYGIFYSQIFSNLGGSGALYPGFTTTQTFARIGPGKPQPFSLSQGFPLTLVSGVSNPFASEQNATVSNPLNPSAEFGFISPMPRVHQWNIGIQRELPYNIIVDASYVGARGIHLELDSHDFNSVPLSSFEAVAAAGTSTATQNARPFPTVGTLNAFVDDGNSIYHSLQIKAERRFSAGLGLQATYTYSKSIDDGSGVFNFSQPFGLNRGLVPTFLRNLDRAVSTFDRPHVFTVAGEYELPFGHGKRFLNRGDSQGEKLARAIFGGFQVNAFVSARSGLPATITETGVSTLSISQPRPSELSGASLQVVNQPGPNGTIQYFQAIGSASFPFVPVGPLYTGSGATRTQILPFTLGNVGRDTVRGPGYFDADLSLIRRFRIKENLLFDFRVEAFNAFNHTNLLFDSTGATTNLPVIVSANQAVFNPASTFGQISTALPGRRFQMVAKIEF